MTAQTTTHSPARINPDTLPVLVAAIVVGLLVPAAASFTLSFDGLSAVAPWAAVRPERAWLIPVSIDAAQIGFTLAAFIHIARGESARWAWTWVTLWTLVSASANAAHAWSSGPGSWEGIAGAGLAAFFPIGTLVTSHTAARIMIGRLSAVAASAVEVDGQADTDTRTDRRTPNPLAVLEEIEQAAPIKVVDEPVAVTVAAMSQLTLAARTPGTDGQAGTRTDADSPVASVRPVRSSASVEAVRPEIERRAREGTSGREIARQLGLGRTRTCEIVREIKKAGERFELVQETYPA